MNSMSYNADEILAVAIEIEHNAARYYTDAAKFTGSNPALSALFSDLSDMEHGHALTFSAMRDDLSESEKKTQPYDPGNEMLYYLRGMAGLHGWEGKAGPNAGVTGSESEERIITVALDAEKDSVFLYEFLSDYIPPSRGRAAVGRIIKEEMRHVAILNHQLESRRAAP